MNAVVETWFLEIGRYSMGELCYMVRDGLHVICDFDDGSVCTSFMDWEVLLSSDTLEGLAALCQRDLVLWDAECDSQYGSVEGEL